MNATEFAKKQSEVLYVSEFALFIYSFNNKNESLDTSGFCLKEA